MPDGPSAEAGHQRPRSESRGEPPAEVGDPSDRVEELSVDWGTRIPRCRRPIAVKYDETGDGSSYSVSPGHRSLRLGESRSPRRQSADSLSAGDRSFGPCSY